MKKLNRRSFLQKAGLVTAGMISAPYLPLSANPLDEGSTPSNSTATTPLSATAAPTIEGDHFRVVPTDHAGALVNPNMGWTMHYYSCMLEKYGFELAPSDTLEDFPGLGAVYLRIPWSFLEPKEGEFVWELLDTPAQRWIQSGRQVCFRITAMESWLQKATPQWVFDAGVEGYGVDNDRLVEPDYASPIFLERVENCVKAMAERYDNNPNVCFVDIGHYGMWGEGHTVSTSPKHGKEWGIEVQKAHIDIYCRHFHRTQLCISDDYAGPFDRGERFPITDYALSRGVCLRDDSILVSKYPKQWYHSEMAQAFWPTLPVVLEHEHMGLSIKRGDWDAEQLVSAVEAYHASYMSIHWYPREELEACREEIDRINRRIGYRLRLNEARWPQQVTLGEEFSIRSTWSNAGVAPCYGGGYPCFTIKDAEGGIISVLVDQQLNVGELEVGAPEEAPTQEITRTFCIAPYYKSRNRVHFRSAQTGEFDLFVSIGKADGTPIYELPYGGNDGHKRYKIGRITLTGEQPPKTDIPY